MNWRTVALKTAIGFGVAVGLVLLAPRAQAQEDATAMTRQSNASVAQQLPFQDSEDFEDARRGFVATLPDATIRSSDGRVVWSLKDYEFLKDEAPPTVNPSLWRVARLNLNHGLFKVTDRIYQIRGFDISNMDIIEGDTGLIVIDPLISAESRREWIRSQGDRRKLVEDSDSPGPFGADVSYRSPRETGRCSWMKLERSTSTTSTTSRLFAIMTTMCRGSRLESRRPRPPRAGLAPSTRISGTTAFPRRCTTSPAAPAARRPRSPRRGRPDRPGSSPGRPSLGPDGREDRSTLPPHWHQAPHRPLARRGRC